MLIVTTTESTFRDTMSHNHNSWICWKWNSLFFNGITLLLSLKQISYGEFSGFSLVVIFLVLSFSSNKFRCPVLLPREKMLSLVRTEKFGLFSKQMVTQSLNAVFICVAEPHCVFFVGSLCRNWSWIDHVPCPIILCLFYHCFGLFWENI